MAGRGCVYRKWGRKGFCVRFTVSGRTRWKGGFSTKTNARRWLENHVTQAERDIATVLTGLGETVVSVDRIRRRHRFGESPGPGRRTQGAHFRVT